MKNQSRQIEMILYLYVGHLNKIGDQHCSYQPNSDHITSVFSDQSLINFPTTNHCSAIFVPLVLFFVNSLFVVNYVI